MFTWEASCLITVNGGEDLASFAKDIARWSAANPPRT